MDREKFRKKAADFFKTEHQKLAGYVRKRIDDAADRDSEDVIQDVFLNLFNLPDVTIPVENLAAYVYRSIRNRIIDIMRKKKESVPLDDVLNDSDVYLNNTGFREDDVYLEMEYNETRDALFSAIDSLNDEYREIIIMTEFEGRSFKDISLEKQVPVGTLLSRKSRAMKILQEKLLSIKENNDYVY